MGVRLDQNKIIILYPIKYKIVKLVIILTISQGVRVFPVSKVLYTESLSNQLPLNKNTKVA